MRNKPDSLNEVSANLLCTHTDNISMKILLNDAQCPHIVRSQFSTAYTVQQKQEQSSNPFIFNPCLNLDLFSFLF